MIISSNQDQLKEAITDCINADRSILTSPRDEIRPLKSATHRIQPRSTTPFLLLQQMEVTTNSSLIHFSYSLSAWWTAVTMNIA